MYLARQYPCAGGNQNYDVQLYNSAGSLLQSVTFTAKTGQGFIRQVPLAAGTYTIKAGMSAGYQPTAGYPHDFNVGVYAADYMPITDLKGAMSSSLSVTFYDDNK